MTAPRVYLAGFDVFRPDAVAYGAHLQAECAARGLIGLYPLDQAAPAGLSPHETADWIFRNNVALIDRADAVVANLNPFRGHEPDSGTAFEVGYACARGKPVWGYFDDVRDIVSRVAVSRLPAEDGIGAAVRHVDGDGMLVEDFDLPVNLMLACSVTRIHGDVQHGLDAVARHFAR